MFYRLGRAQGVGIEMLFQIHHQSIRDTKETIFCIQADLPNGSYVERRDFMKKIIDEAWAKYPPPKGYQFMVCTEKSPYFLLTEIDNQSIHRIAR